MKLVTCGSGIRYGICPACHRAHGYHIPITPIPMSNIATPPLDLPALLRSTRKGQCFTCTRREKDNSIRAAARLGLTITTKKLDADTYRITVTGTVPKQQEPPMRSLRDSIHADIREAMENAQYWRRQKALCLQPEDRAHAGGLMLLWENQLTVRKAKLNALNVVTAPAPDAAPNIGLRYSR